MKKFLLIIGNKNYSSWSLRPWLLLKYFQIPFEETMIVLYQQDSRKKLLQHSPAGKVPIFKDGDLIIWDSLAIAEYLVEQAADKNLWPQDPSARAIARSVSAEMHSGFLDMRTDMSMNIREHKPLTKLRPETERDVNRVIQIWTDCRHKFGHGGDFLFGAFSIADAMYAPVVWRFKTYGVQLSSPVLEYSQAMLALPAMKEWEAAALKEPWLIH